jgi:N-acetylmuramoyl-L-alanine amidase
MRSARVYVSLAVVVVVLILLIVGAAAHQAATPSSRSARASGAAAVTSHSAGASGDAGAQSVSAGIAVNPAYFAPGTCMEFPPLTGNRDLTVFLDAGHGGLDPGAVGLTSTGKTIYEADETLPVVLDTMTILRRAGFQVVVSRTGPTSVLRLRPVDVSGHVLSVVGSHDDVAARDVCANAARANVLVGVYFNSGASAGNAGCITAYDSARSFADDNRRLAGLVQSAVLAAMNAQGWQIPDGGVQPDQELGSSLTPADLAYGHLLLLGPAKAGYFNTPSMMPGALIEPLFITDPFEGSIAASTRGQQVIATGLARAIEQYFGPRQSP